MYPKVVSVKPEDDYMLSLVFEDGKHGTFDVKPYIRGSWFGQLADRDFFDRVTIQGLSVAWPDGQDIAPDCLYTRCAG